MEQRAAAAVGHRTLRNMAWAYGSYVGGRVLTLVVTAILARLLTPTDFGLVALVLVAITLLESLRDLGVTQALVLVDEGEEEDYADTTFMAGMAVALLFAALVAASAPAAAAAFDEPAVAGLLIVMGLRFPLRALGATHYALAQKRLDFASRTAAEIIDVVVRGAVGIGLALAGAGAWALVGGYLAGTAAMALTLWLRVPWRPRLRLRREHLPRLLRFGGVVTLVDVLAAFIFTVDNLFVGSVLGPAALGLYALAYRLPELVVQNLANVAGQVLFPAFASLGRERLGPAYLLALRSTLLVVVPAAVLLAVLAEELLVLAFGDRWRPAADAMAVLAAYAALTTVSIPSGMAYKATGRPGILLALAVPRAVLLVISLAIFTEDGIAAVAACQAGGAALLTVASTVVAGRILRVGPGAIVRAVLPFAAAGGAAALAAATLAGAVEDPIPTVLAAGTGGLLVYAGAVAVLARGTLRDLRLRLRPAAPAAPTSS